MSFLIAFLFIFEFVVVEKFVRVDYFSDTEGQCQDQYIIYQFFKNEACFSSIYNLPFQQAVLAKFTVHEKGMIQIDYNCTKGCEKCYQKSVVESGGCLFEPVEFYFTPSIVDTIKRDNDSDLFLNFYDANNVNSHCSSEDFLWTAIERPFCDKFGGVNKRDICHDGKPQEWDYQEGICQGTPTARDLNEECLKFGIYEFQNSCKSPVFDRKT